MSDQSIELPLAADDFLKYRVKKKLNNLSKNYLMILEDLRDIDGYVFPKDKFDKIRKRVLDYAGDTRRELEDDLNNLDICYKNR